MMTTDQVFISHATDDDAFVKELRRALEDQRVPVWVDSRNLRGGDALDPNIHHLHDFFHGDIFVDM